MLAVQPIDSCWKGSALAFPPQSYDISTVSDYPLVLKMATLLCCALLIIFAGTVLQAIAISFRTYFQGRRIREAEYNQTHLTSINVTFAICMVILTVIFYKNLDTQLSYMQLIILFLAIAGIRMLLSILSGWLSKKHEMIFTARLSFRIHAIAFTTMLLPLAPLRLFWPQTDIMVTTCYITAIFIITYIPYVYQLVKIFIADNCSLFFRFLYLCEVEFFTIGLFIIAIFTL